jgi:hypothetical protein
VTARIGSGGADMCAGATLAGLRPPPAVETLRNEGATVEVTVAQAARMFSLNIDAWSDEGAARSPHEPGDLPEMARRLRGRLDDDRRGVIVWRVRQLVLRVG